MTPAVKLYLFDIDGTLLKTDGAGRRATHDAIQEVFGTSAGLDGYHFGGKTDWYTLTLLLSEFGHTQESIGQRMRHFEAAMGRHMARHIRDYPARALPGALDAVARLHQTPGVLLGIVTGNAPTSARVKLESARFNPDWFLVGAFGTESVNRDALPRLALQRASQHVGQTLDAAYVTVIGDTALDVQAARASGMRVVGVRTGFEDAAVLAAAEPDELLDDLTTLLDVL